MKFPIPAAVAVATVLLTGCNSLENPFPNLLGTGRDRRVFNSQTGEWEWPKEEEKRQKKSRVSDLALGATPAPERQTDGRYFDMQKNQWVEAPEERSSSRPRTSSARPNTAPPALMTTPVPVGTPPPVRPPRASGVYNPSTGQIEWTDFDPAPRQKPSQQGPKDKRWYWPF